MPYITCPDGNTYSRYDSSPYVKWCIECKKEEARQAELKCMKDPDCIKEKEFQSNVVAFSYLALCLSSLVVFFSMIKLMHSDIK